MGYLPRWGVLFLDLLLCTIAFWISVWIGSSYFNYDSDIPQILPIGQQYLVILIVQTLAFGLFNTYAGILRYSTFTDMLKVLLANVSTGIAIVIFNYAMDWSTGMHPIFNTIVAIYVPVAFVLLFTLRVAVKTFGEVLQQYGNGSPRVLIYGIKYAGVSIAKMLRSAGNTPYRPVGFISDGEHGFEVAGLPVLQLNEKLFDWMKARKIQHVIVSPLKMREINPAKDLQIFIDHNIRILTTPYFTSVDNPNDIDAQRIGRIDAIRIEDLLERPQIDVSTENVRQIIQGKVVLVSGAAGSIGSELVRQIQQYNPQVTILLEIAESPLHDLYVRLSFITLPRTSMCRSWKVIPTKPCARTYSARRIWPTWRSNTERSAS